MLTGGAISHERVRNLAAGRRSVRRHGRARARCPEAADLDPGVLARGLDTPATVKAARLCRRERDRYAHLVRGARGF